VRDIDEIRELIRARSPLAAERTEEIIDVYFRRIPLRTQYALERFPFSESRVLDVGCAYGTSLIHFGPGSVGLDNNPAAVEFSRALGLEVRLGDVDAHLDATDLGRFDFVWVSDILEHLEAPRLLLRSLAPLLAPGGRLVVHTSVLPSVAPARALWRARGKQAFDADVHYFQWTRHTFGHLLARAGYRVTDVLVPRPPGWRRLDPVLYTGLAPRLFFVAAADEELGATVTRSEQRNRRT